MNAHDILIRPVLTEKSYDHIAGRNYCFIVATDATKTDVKEAVEKVFGVQVAKVNTINYMGKMRRQGRTQGRRASSKKAYVQLKPDSKGIEFFDSLTR